MRVHLLHPDSDFDPEAPLPPQSADTTQDLQLDVLWDAVGGGDDLVRRVIASATLRPLTEASRIRYRQDAVQDAVRNREAVAELARIAADALQVEHGIFALPLRGHPGSGLRRSVRVLRGILPVIERLTRHSAAVRSEFHSAAFTGLFATVAEQLDDAFLAELRERLAELDLPRGILLSAGVGQGGQLIDLTLRRSLDRNKRLLSSVALRRPLSSFTLPERDQAGHDLLYELGERALNDVANAAGQSVDHVLAFFRALQTELAFYRGAIQLVDTLTALGLPVCEAIADDDYRAAGLYDPCLAVRTGSAPTGNDIDLRRIRLLILTGANRGGKSTLLRAQGVAQLLFQCGLPAPARELRGPLVGAVHTHWSREEDEQLEHGKLDDELVRMSATVDRLRPGDLLLCNESFSSTDEAEGSQLAVEVTSALAGAGVAVRYVTHLYDFASRMHEGEEIPAAFLRAPRDEDGERSYRLEPGAPLPTSFGVDLFDRRFGTHLADGRDAA